MTLLQLGLILFIAGGIINAVLINFQITGLPRELARASILAGFVLLVVGFFKRKKKQSFFQKN